MDRWIDGWADRLFTDRLYSVLRKRIGPPLVASLCLLLGLLVTILRLLAMRKAFRCDRAATRVQCGYRRRVVRRAYCVVRAATIHVQAAARGRRCAKQLTRMRSAACSLQVASRVRAKMLRYVYAAR